MTNVKPTDTTLIRFNIASWYAWAPEIDSKEAWHRWARGLMDIGSSGTPNVDFLQPMLRRRLSRLSKMSLAVAHGCLGKAFNDPMRSVFASRYGELHTTVALLNKIVKGEVISPTQFSLSVHNTASGLFSLAANNPLASTALSGGKDTFCYAVLEAAGILHHYPELSVLVVMADEPLPDVYAEFSDEDEVSYGLALLLTKKSIGQTVNFGLRRSSTTEAQYQKEPQALSFLRWFLLDARNLTLHGRTFPWLWVK